MRDSSDKFTVVVGGRRCRCSSATEFLSRRICHIHCIDATTDELRLEIGDAGGLFGSGLSVTGGGDISIEAGNQANFKSICAGLWNWERYESVLGELGEGVKIENRVDRP
jgi:hypothetical protein